jgi:hypothetical protein
MKKFVLLAHGEMTPTSEFQQAHQRWWSGIQEHVLDPGSPLVHGRSVTRDGDVAEIPSGQPALGYSIVEAESIEHAIALLADCPMDMWVYEAMAM